MDYASRVRLPSLGRTSAGHFLVHRKAGSTATKSASSADATLLRRLVNFYNSRPAARTDVCAATRQSGLAFCRERAGAPGKSRRKSLLQ